jgi:hypothetical protein
MQISLTTETPPDTMPAVLMTFPSDVYHQSIKHPDGVAMQYCRCAWPQRHGGLSTA